MSVRRHNTTWRLPSSIRPSGVNALGTFSKTQLTPLSKQRSYDGLYIQQNVLYFPASKDFWEVERWSDCWYLILESRPSFLYNLILDGRVSSPDVTAWIATDCWLLSPFWEPDKEIYLHSGSPSSCQRRIWFRRDLTQPLAVITRRTQAERGWIKKEAESISSLATSD